MAVGSPLPSKQDANNTHMDTFDYLFTFQKSSPCCGQDIDKQCSCRSSSPKKSSSPWKWKTFNPFPPTTVSPINVPLLLEILKLDPNRARARFLSRGFYVGFRIGFTGALLPTRPRNLLSARNNPDGVRKAIHKEISKGHTAGPFETPPFEVTHVSPLGAVEKPDGSYRLILDLSSPRGCSINEGIPKDQYSVEYSKFDEALDLVRRAGRGCMMAKIDIESAFRIVPVHPDDWNKLCFSLDGFYFTDTRLSFGSRSSPFIFNTFADFLAWFLSSIIGIALLVHYLDDFFISSPNFDSCQSQMNKMLNFCKLLGVPVNMKKVFGPLPSIPYLGIQIDSNAMVCRLPEEKLSDIQNILKSWLHKKSCTKRNLLSLIGKLSFACKVVKPGRIFLRRLIDLSMTTQHLDHFIHLNQEAKADILWWHDFIVQWNGVSIIPSLPSQKKLSLFTDASMFGIGGFLGPNWFSVPVPSTHKDIHINVKELVAVLAAISAWADILSNKEVVLFSDNLTIVQAWTGGTSSSKVLMNLIRKIFLLSAKYGISLHLRHIFGFQNFKADALSRLLIQKFKDLHPVAKENPTWINPAVWSL